MSPPLQLAQSWSPLVLRDALVTQGCYLDCNDVYSTISPFYSSYCFCHFCNPFAVRSTNWQINLLNCYFPSQGFFFFFFFAEEIETNELLIWQYDLRNIFALSEMFISYLKEEGKGLVLRMAGYWNQEVLNVQWDYALQEVEEVGGKGGGHQKHLHLHLKKG